MMARWFATFSNGGESTPHTTPACHGSIACPVVRLGPICLLVAMDAIFFLPQRLTFHKSWFILLENLPHPHPTDLSHHEASVPSPGPLPLCSRIRREFCGGR